MHNWKQIVRERLESAGCGIAATESVVSELAGHLRETYQTALSRGLMEQAAIELTLQEVDDWRVLAKNICRAQAQEDRMNQRTKSLWLPALATFFGASVSLTLCQLLGLRPQLVWVAKMGMTFYWPWLFTLPLFGAAGAYLSQRSQGTILAKLAASLSPALVMLTVMLIVLPWGLHLDGLEFFRLVAFGLGLINWVAIPALALLLGAAPFLKQGVTPLAHQD